VLTPMYRGSALVPEVRFMDLLGAGRYVGRF
jgi:hypothetical protein